ncbi:MAG: hypothetical protein H7Y88_03770 [Phycisphaerales bacterium]|nr:hypothetical protein [Phycisphaerales bacterium]
MSRRGRLRRALRPIALVVSALLLSLSVATWYTTLHRFRPFKIELEVPPLSPASPPFTMLQLSVGSSNVFAQVMRSSSYRTTRWEFHVNRYLPGILFNPYPDFNLRLPSCSYHAVAGTRFYRAELPLWLPTLAFGLCTAWLGFATSRDVRRQWRDRRGRCTKCNYDLSGLTPLPTGAPAPCPECGTPR